MDVPDGMDKSWDHPWTTEEMRKKRREWSLAGDAGLLKHLQEFSDNLVSKANKTQEALDVLTNQLNETSILINNVTNTSLALANTQFIESRVQEDNIDIEKKPENIVEESKDQDLITADLIASVSESVRQGLNIMDEKYKRMEVIDSDSEEEEDAVVLSIILGPNNPYQDRPLPYVIGSDMWKNSNKIGLESSSSESEQVDEEEEEESRSDKDHITTHRVFDTNLTPKKNISRLSSPLSESDNYIQRNDMMYVDNEKIDGICQNNVNSTSESITPNTVSKAPLANDSTPNFAEELAKRLGTVRQAQKPLVHDERSEASINLFQDDLFTPEDDNGFSNKTENIFDSNNDFFDNQSSSIDWKEKPKPFKTNIPASIDVPPPISIISTKPKSAIDDLFDDADSEDSTDIFSSKSTVKKLSKDNSSNSNNYATHTERAQKKYLDIAAPTVTGKMATSTPETDANAASLFSNDDDDEDLFGISKDRRKSESAPTSSRKKPGNVLSSDTESKLSSRTSRTQSPGLSNSDKPPNNESARSNNSIRDSSWGTAVNDNTDDGSFITGARRNAENLTAANESNNTSGISIHPPSINNTRGSSIGVDFQPQMTSTRLKSEDIYCESVDSDSLFVARTRNPIASATTNSNVTGNQFREERNEDNSSMREDDVFENEDLFGPPPLPKADSKSFKSKVSSLFDDSDSGDELFSTTSSGSRSQKSTDFLGAASQHTDKIKSTQRRDLFDEEIDIFGNKDSPDVDIFGITSKSVVQEANNTPVQKLPEVDDDLFASNKRDLSKSNVVKKKPSAKKISLFDDDDEDGNDDDLFSAKLSKREFKPDSGIFKEDENNLFSFKNVIDEREPKDGKIPAESSKMDEVDEKNTHSRKTERSSSGILSGNGLFLDNVESQGFIFEDDDYDDLFGKKSITAVEREGKNKAESKTNDDVKFGESIFDKTVNDFPSMSDSSVLEISNDRGTDNANETVSSKIKEVEEPIRSNVTEDKSNLEEIENDIKKNPPTSLNIPIASATMEETNQTQRRIVSGKIKNLMGKMGDFKILSPMDAPPLWRRSEEKTDEEDDPADRDSDDGGCISTHGYSSPPSISEDSGAQKQSLQSTVSEEINVESAISFDEPVQVETLSTAASKTRVRIQAKRRPQSRHARKSALRHSGIDFDTVDALESNLQKDQSSESIDAHKESNNSVNVNGAHVAGSTFDRMISSTSNNVQKTVDTNVSLTVDDKSELGSLSKESSMSVNKNTLLSPSTDEEDLFDVPPDLPEDPQKEDALFGRAPILSPVDRGLTEKLPEHFKPLRDTHIKRIDDEEKDEGSIPVDLNSKSRTLIQSDSDGTMTAVEDTVSEKRTEQEDAKSKEPSFTDESSNQEVIDPLRDTSHDPLKDPSQLFAFVTKTPSPEKGKSLLFSEDDSLFSAGTKTASESNTVKKQVLDLFYDDTEGDLFSTSLSKPVKKPHKEAKGSLFSDNSQEDESDNLFGSVIKKPTIKTDTPKTHRSREPRNKTGLFDDDDDNDINLFSQQTEHSQKSDSTGMPEEDAKGEAFVCVTEPMITSHTTDIFADQSSGEDDIFASKPVSKKVVAPKSLFPLDDDDYDDDDNQIFGKATPTIEAKVKPTELRTAVKKPIMRDLKKTAEKIGDDPLSILQDD